MTERDIGHIAPGARPLESGQKKQHCGAQRTMTSAPPSVFRPRPRPENSATLLRLLATPAPSWPEVALVAARDPALCLALLVAAPLHPGAPGDDLGEGLNTALAKRLEALGADLLRTWLCDLDPAPAATQPLLTAECALHLALETRYPRPDEAYLAGLWLPPSGFDRGDATTGSTLPLHQGHPLEADALRLQIARLARGCGLSAAVGDVLELGALLEEQLLAGHPLLRLVHAAQQLAGTDWDERLDAIARLTGIEPGPLKSLRTDVAYIVTGHAAYPAQAAASPRLTAPAASPPAEDPFRAAAIHGLVVAAFSELDEDAAIARLAVACPLLGGRAVPPVLVSDGDGRLHPLLAAGAGRPEALLSELQLAEDDPTSSIALTARSGRPSAHFNPGPGPGRSMADWQVARWLGRRGFCCLPLALGDGFGVAVIAVDHEQDLAAGERWLLGELLSAAVRAIRTAQHRRAAIASREAALQARFREHVRRIAHEASNPLTVIRSRLDLLGQQQPGDTALQEEMSLLNAELDRIGKLLHRAGELPADETELARCNLTELLLEMRALYGQTLFASKGIALELRAASGLPLVAMPPSALKQVLLNLFRNAAEALQPGSRLSVALAGQAIANGRNCVEIRLVDNGPGLPPERMNDLFSARPSSKGGTHQGVGLSVVRDILAQWNASILCRSQSGSGTSFQIFIPLEQTH